MIVIIELLGIKFQIELVGVTDPTREIIPLLKCVQSNFQLRSVETRKMYAIIKQKEEIIYGRY
ncbi:MAG: hypothetical protein U9R26_09735 [Campylobacterota bacterium]|nr:hypothetical protein [Campylobacterota bacterium]